MKYGILLAILFVSGCGGSSFINSVPSNYLQPEEMRYVMWDMLRADEYYNRILINDSTHQLQKENFKLYDQVFRSYGITKEKYYSSFKFYESHPKLFKELVDSVEATSKQSREKALKQLK